jgi:2-oxoglutarate ferredoxin oxidoreductase subunit gamma
LKKKTEVRIVGLGGQGIVIAGQILGRAAAYDRKNAVQTQSYGAEARGSAAKSEVIISDGKIGFPIVRKCDVLIAMSQETLEKNVKDLEENGTLLVDSSIIRDIPETSARVFKIPATQTSEKDFGEKLYANMIMLGALVKTTSIVSSNALENSIRDTVTKKAVSVNIEAYMKGKLSAASP